MTVNPPVCSGVRFKSRETTSTWDPNLLAISETSSGLSRAADEIETLSAPASKSFATSSTDLTPPPTVRGMNTLRAVLLTNSVTVDRPCLLAFMSKKVISSAPSRKYLCANSTGSPASMRLTKLTPLTTRPSATSRQGMILVVSGIRFSQRVSH